MPIGVFSGFGGGEGLFTPPRSKPSSSGRKPISKSLRDDVWFKYMGDKVQGKCYCCKMRPIHFSDFQVGHNKAVARGGKNHLSNLRPICAHCNRAMGTKTIEWWRNKHYGEPKEPVKRTPKKPRKPKKPSSMFGFPSSKLDFDI